MNPERCSCDYTERETKHRASWDRIPTGGAFDVRLEPWPPYPVWHYSDCAALDDFPLQPPSSSPVCPKCTSTDIRTTYHEARWLYTPHPHDYWRTDLYKWDCLLTHAYRPVGHLDRDCQTCRFGWLEAVQS